jgi:branched-chain amino acid transport system ATP-binding protein
MTPAPREILLRLEHLTMRFGGLVAVQDLSFEAARGAITALIGPNGAGKTTVFNCITGFYKPSEGRIALQHGDPRLWDDLEVLTARGQRSLRRPEGALFLLERMPDFLVTHKARVTRTFQNIRLFQGMSVLENLLVAQHNPLMIASGFTALGIFGSTGWKKSTCLTAPTTPPANSPMARSAASKWRAPCAPIPCCFASTSRPPD